MGPLRLVPCLILATEWSKTYHLQEMQQFSRKEKYLVANTLSCVPVILQGHAVLIDLLNEASVAGKIEKADGIMNIVLSEVVYIDRNGRQYPFDEFMVRSRMIRQIHIPAYLNMEKELRNWTEYGLRPKRQLLQGSTKRTFKQKRAQERHKEIVEQIAERNKNHNRNDKNLIKEEENLK